MNTALWLLIRLQLRGWLRYLGRSLRTVKGALLGLVGFSVFLPWLLSIVLMPHDKMVPAEQVRQFGPAMLLGYCLFNVLLSSGERSVYFTPAEVNFLFPGPFGRREVLLYKIVFTLLVGVPTTFLMTAFLNVYAPWLPAAYVGLLLMFAFMQLFGMAVSLVITSVGVRLYSRGRQVLLAGVVVLAVLVLFQAGAFGTSSERQAFAQQILQTPAWRAVTLPLGWFFDAFLATRVWPDLAAAAGLGLLVNLALLGVVMSLDAHYLESAAAVSARVYARIQRMRRGGLAGDAPGGGGRVRFSVPALPWWGGIGPVLWRQLTTALRGLGRLLLVFALLGFFLVLPMVMSLRAQEGNLAYTVAGCIFGLTMFLTTLVPFDFRGDVDRLGLLKTLPLPTWRLTVGQLLTPALFMTLVQWLVLGVTLPIAGGNEWLLAALAAYAPAFNFLLFGMENLLFLLFPTRLLASNPGDFQALGRNVLFVLGKLAGMGVVGLLAGYFGWSLGLLTGSLAVGLAAGWLVLALCGIALVPLVGFAFRAFDVGRDTPA